MTEAAGGAHKLGPYRDAAPRTDAGVFEPYLEQDEELLWTGRPLTGLRFSWVDIFLVPFTGMWGAFAILGAVSTWVEDGPLFFRLAGVPLVLVGLYLIFGRFLLAARARSRTRYALTPTRALIVSGIFRRRLQTVRLATLGAVDFHQNGRGVGTLVFDAPRALPTIYLNALDSFPGLQASTSFSRLPNAEEAYQLVQKLQRNLARNPSATKAAHAGSKTR